VALIAVLVPLAAWKGLPEFAGPRLLAGGILLAASAWWCVRAIVRNPRIPLGLALIDILFAAFYALYLVSWAFSSGPGVSLTAVLLEAPFPVFYIACRALFRKGEEGRGLLFLVAGAVTLTAAALAAWGLVQYFFEIDISGNIRELFKTHHYPVVASMGNPNYLSEFLVLALPFMVAFFTRIRRFGVMAAALAVTGLAVYLTYSRLAWFVLACVMLLVIAFSHRPARDWLAGALAALVLITGAFFAFHYLSGTPQSDRVVQSFALSRTTPLFERRVLYASGFTMLGDAGALGAGPGMFGVRYLEYQGRYVSTAQADRFQLKHLVDIDHAHSDLIEIAFDSGIPSALAFLALLVAALVLGIARARLRDHAAYVALVPLVYLPFCLWSFPFYIPFSKMLLVAALAFLASGSRPLLAGEFPGRLTALVLAALLALWGSMAYRYAASLYLYTRASDAHEKDPALAEELYTGALGAYPHQGHAYLGRGTLRAAQKHPGAVDDLRKSLDYVNDAGSYLALARALRDRGMTDEARRWYRKLMYLRPDIRKAVQEYRELGPATGDAQERGANENNR